MTSCKEMDGSFRSGMVAHTFNPSAQETRQVDLWEFKTSLIYKVQDSQGYPEKPCLQEQKSTTTTTTTTKLKTVKMEVLGVQPLDENLESGSRPGFQWKKLLLVVSGIQGAGLLLCLIYICMHLYPSPVKYPPIQSLRAQVTRCEEGRLFISLSRNEYQTMEVQNNSVAITCDGLYLIYMKGSFFQEVKINLHFRKGRSPISIPTLNNGQRVDFPVVASLAFKDIVYFTVDAPDISCEHLQINDGELIIVQLTPGGFCAH
ncbi:tumor necrosis factor ligand superfamily member 4 isoform X4 [Meriones unguiculatus]|uniref:tumor necrosis factor ligand superfamily member 4 isoform X4 n=1 Tax=Meriones unguiculatus TaxID=10047 RepID=UPI00293EE71E|nr:tumor necrosis factor ligand superfamily member 4 isoform X4 [Meriones unguiculatus]XP_060220542.1 tumor necrosis factor ligand superfamily member 4 isoform X4 [Meriones unguiculatus]XP_060220543.1 tumor necrosis factor ligand superfamily member 4 isoform X4 [Meriones unguiculatus]